MMQRNCHEFFVFCDFEIVFAKSLSKTCWDTLYIVSKEFWSHFGYSRDDDDDFTLATVGEILLIDFREISRVKTLEMILE